MEGLGCQFRYVQEINMVIVITLPDFIDGEGEKIVRLLQRVELIHIRKPNASEAEVERLINDIPPEYHSRLVLHDHHQLASKYNLYGVHLNGRNPIPPDNWKGSVSRSCHSLDEVMEWKQKCNYVSLSPIYNSISKVGYMSAFTKEDIIAAKKDGIIDAQVMALGGVTFEKLDEVREMGFGGAMILGDAWKE